MSRATVIIRNEADRARIAYWAAKAPEGTRVDFKAVKRSLPQNARFWAMLSDIASQLAWHGQKLRTEDWRLIFLDALKREVRVAPSLDGRGFVNLGRSSSDLSKAEMSDLMILMEQFGAEHDVKFHDQEAV